MAYFEVTQPSDNTSFTVWIRDLSSSESYSNFIISLEKMDASGKYVFYGNYHLTTSSMIFTNLDIQPGAYLIYVYYDTSPWTKIYTKNGQEYISKVISSGGSSDESIFTLDSNQGKIDVVVTNNNNYISFFYLIYDSEPPVSSYPYGSFIDGEGHSGISSSISYQFSNLLGSRYYWVGVAGRYSNGGDWQPCYWIDSSTGEGTRYAKIWVQNSSVIAPSFTATKSGNDKIYVTISDNGGGTINGKTCRILFGSAVQYTINNFYDQDSWLSDSLSTGTYVVKVQYQDTNNNWIDIGSSCVIEITNDPIPQTWSYTKIPSNIPGGINVSSVGNLQSSYSDIKKNGKKFVIYFNQAGTLRIWSTNTNGGLISYAETEDNGYDETTGKPYNSGNATIGSFDYSLYGSQGTYFYLWVNSDSTTYGYYLNTSFVAAPTPITVPSYTFSINDNKITFNVSDKGNFYLSYIARLWDDQDDRSYTNYYTNNTTVTTSALLYNTKYAVNVGYSTEINGVITWIEKRAAQIGNEKEPFNYSLISGITISDSNPNPLPISFAKNNGVIVPITISYNGVVTVYTETNQSITMNDVAYLCNSSNESYTSTGVVNNYIKFDDNSHGNYEFQMTIDNTNIGTQVYYLYIRGIIDPEDNNTPIAINTRLYAIIPEEECVWIYTGISTNGGWQKAIPYIYTGSGSENGWQKAIPYIYDGSSWKKTTG